MWVEFVVGSLLFSERFLSGYSSFPLSLKTNSSKFQFDQESGSSSSKCATSKSLFYFFIYPTLFLDQVCAFTLVQQM